MDHYVKEELIVDQFLMGMDSHELNIQVAARDHRRVDDILRVAHSLEAVRKEEKQYSQGQKPTPQARFVTKERSRSPDTDRLVKEVLAQIGRDTYERRDTWSRPPMAHPGYQVLLDILFRLGLIANCSHTVQYLDCSDLNWLCNHYHLFLALYDPFGVDVPLNCATTTTNNNPLAPRGSEVRKEKTLKLLLSPRQETIRETHRPPMTIGPEVGKTWLSAIVAQAMVTLLESALLMDSIKLGLTAHLLEWRVLSWNPARKAAQLKTWHPLPRL